MLPCLLPQAFHFIPAISVKPSCQCMHAILTWPLPCIANVLHSMHLHACMPCKARAAAQSSVHDLQRGSRGAAVCRRPCGSAWKQGP